MGLHVNEFEKMFAKHFGSRFCVMVNSGSSANLLMIASLFYVRGNNQKLKPGDEVIVPAVSWSTTYYPLHQYGLKLKFVDIDPDTLNIDINAVRQAIGPRTKAILAVNLLGNPCDLKDLKDLATNHSVVLLEDNCESMGAKVNGKMTGTYGLMGTFSTFFSHHISTMEGGLIVTDNEELYHILLSLRSHGWTRNLPNKNFVTGQKNTNPFEESFKFVLPGYNVRPLELEAAIGIEQLKKLPDLIDMRRKNAKLWRKLMNNHEHLRIQKETGKSSGFGFSVVIRENSPLNRVTLIDKLEAAGFECRPIVAGNFTKNSVVKFFNYEIFGTLNHANRIDTHGLFIGNHHYPIEEALHDIAMIKF